MRTLHERKVPTVDLFEQITGEPRNLLPYDGMVHYYGCVISETDARHYFDRLLTGIAWQNDEAIIFGKKIITKRKVAWYGDAPFPYTYSKVTRTALPWTETLLHLKDIVQSISQETYNACLLNLYHDGSEGMSWHSDAEKDLKPNAAIGSLSFGSERKFSFKHKKDKKTLSQNLQAGSLLVMKDDTQTHWLHSIPKTKSVLTPRINLTFCDPSF